MFKGIIDTVRKVYRIEKNRITVENNFYKSLDSGESIAVDGTCLTLVRWNEKEMFFDVSPQTFKVTSLRLIKPGDYVNIERAMRAGDRIGGHFVSGHVDEIGSVESITRDEDFYIFRFRVSSTRYIVEKGSVAINGISLTAFDIDDKTFKVAVIPHTYLNTNLRYLREKSYVNIEFDMILKYISKNEKKSSITYQYLKENGFI